MDIAQFALLVIVAAVAGVIAKLVKQPPLIGYLLAGVVLSATGAFPQTELLEQLGKVGITLLLFTVGIELTVTDVKTIGKVSLITGALQILITTAAGYGIARLLGIGSVPAIYIALALTFSSTIIVVKLLSEKNDLASLYGKIAVGFLLVQDFFALLVMIVLTGLSSGEGNVYQIGSIMFRAGFLLFLVMIFAKYLLPLFYEKVLGTSSELVLIGSIAWALGTAIVVAKVFGLSLEIGGFLAGFALSALPEHIQISVKVKPLRDFFLMIFFITLGAKLALPALATVIVPVSVLSLFVIVGNPLIVLGILGALGYRKRTSFFVGLSIAQISEFSFILMAMGEAAGVVSAIHVAIVVLVGVITMVSSTYLVLSAEWLYKVLKKPLSLFERKHTHEKMVSRDQVFTDHVVIIGGGRTGWEIMKHLQKQGTPVLLIDFDPAVILKATHHKADTIFGDITDEEVLEASGIKNAKAVISTTPALFENAAILNFMKAKKNKTPIVMVAHDAEGAKELYKMGASYVIVPNMVSSQHVIHLLETHGFSYAKFKGHGNVHQEALELI
jgi:Kef-type K+ transport system membrane component KefB